MRLGNLVGIDIALCFRVRKVWKFWAGLIAFERSKVLVRLVLCYKSFFSMGKIMSYVKFKNPAVFDGVLGVLIRMIINVLSRKSRE